MSNPYVGRTVFLTRIPAYSHELGGDLLVSGEWIIEEYQPVEYGAGITTECFTLASQRYTDEDGDPLFVTVDPAALIEQIDPAAHMATLAMEHDEQIHGERRAEAEIDGALNPASGHPYEGILRAHPREARA